MTYQWRKDGVAIPGANQSIYLISSASASDAGAYSVVIVNAGGSVTSSSATLKVIGAGTPPVAASGYLTCVAATNVSSRAWSHTVPNGKNRLLVVGVALADDGKSVTGVAYGGVPLNRIIATNKENTSELWCLVAPSVGTANLVVTWSGNEDMVGWSGSFTNVDQTSPIRSFKVAGGESLSPSVSLASADGDLVVDTLSANGDAGSVSAGLGQTQIGQDRTGTAGGDCWGAASYQPGAANVTMSWLTIVAKRWAIAAASLRAAPSVQADVVIAASGPADVVVGANFSYNIAVTNAGASTATNVVVTDQLPLGAAFYSASAGGTSSNGVVTWPAFNLAPNSSTNFTLTVTPIDTLPLTNKVSSTASTYDPDALNNNGSAAASTVITSVTPQGSPVPGEFGGMTFVAATNVASRSWAHTVSNGNDRILLVGIALADNQESVTGVSFGGAALSRIVSTNQKNTVEMWYLLNPPVGTRSILATWTGDKDMAGWSGTFYDVNQSNPIRSFAVAGGDSLTPSVSLPTAPGDLVIDTLSANGDAGSVAAGPSQTVVGQNNTGTSGGDCWGTASYKTASTTSSTMSWTYGSGKDWGIAAVALKASLAAQADVSAMITGPETVPANSNFNCIVSIANVGPQPASNVVVTARLPDGLQFISATAGGIASDGGATWTIPVVGVDAIVHFTMTLKATAAGTFTNRITATASTSDPHPQDNAWGIIITATPVAPSIVNQPQSQTIAAGQSVTLQVVASGTGPLGYQWFFKGEELPGATGASLTVEHAQRADAGGYSALVSNTVGSVTSVVASVTVTNPPVTLTPGNGGSMSTSGFSFQLNVPVGVTFIIEASSDCRNWSPIYTNTANASPVVFTDAAAANFPSRLYRARIE